MATPHAWDWLFIEHAARGCIASLEDFPELCAALARYGLQVLPGMGAQELRRLCIELQDESERG